MRLPALSLGLITVCFSSLFLTGCNLYNGPDRTADGAGLNTCLKLQREINTGYYHRAEDRRMNPATRARIIKQYDQYRCNQMYHLGDYEGPADIMSPSSMRK